MSDHESMDHRGGDAPAGGPPPAAPAGPPSGPPVGPPPGAAPWPTAGSQAGDPTRLPPGPPPGYAPGGPGGPPPGYYGTGGPGGPPGHGPGGPPPGWGPGGPGGPPPGYGPGGPAGPGGPGGPPEFLEYGGGQPVPPSGGRPGAGKRIALVTVGAVALAGIGVGGWAVYNFVASGPQPAEALPASTIGYASIDLDPAGKQKLEALKFLNRFPSFKSEVGLDSGDDLRERIFDEIQKDAPCEGLDYGDDIEPWLGDRFGMAAVDLGEDEPTPVVVIQVKDKGKAEEGMDKILDCAGDSEDIGGFVVQDDWLIAVETQELADKTVDEAEDGTLADDEDYQKWTDEVGDAGFVNMYAGPALGDYLADHPDVLQGGSADLVGAPTEDDWADTETDTGGVSGLVDDVTGDEPPEELLNALRDFSGAAGAIRFDDGTVEFAMAADAKDNLLASGDEVFSDEGGDIVAGLPDDTAAAFGAGFREGWLQTMLDRAVELSGGELDADEVLAELETETGLDLPGDLEALLGEQAVIAVGGDIDPDSFNSGDGSDLPIGVLMKGDPEAAEAALDKLRLTAGDGSSILESTSDADHLAVGPDSGYRDQLLEGGNLGGTDKFRDVVPEADRAAVAFYLDFDAADDWLVELARSDGDDETADNLEPLSAAGMSSWIDGDVAHTSIRVSTE